MGSFIEDEARGDWRNFKGDHYHIVYLVWSLLHEGGQIAFYQGNDLHRVVRPPALIDEGKKAEPLIMRFNDGDIEDQWIQLKAVEGANWTCTAIFQDLLENFLFNALISTKEGRRWRVKLITQSSIATKSVLEFVDAIINPSSTKNNTTLAKSSSSKSTKTSSKTKKVFQEPKSNISTFKEIVRMVVKRWNSEFTYDPVTEKDVETLGLQILRQIAAQQPLRLDVMKLQCQIKLLPLHPDMTKVDAILNTLSGAILEEARKGPEHARHYDVAWLESAAREILSPKSLFETDPQAACENANRVYLPRDWDPSYFTPRPELESALRDFLVASETSFCLIGLSGTGKSWATAWVIDKCQEHLCLLVRASEIQIHPTIPGLVASRLSRLSSVQNSEEELVRRWKAASLPGKTPVLILDDFLVSSVDARQLRAHLQRLCEQAKQYQIKLIFTCQAQIWRINDLGGGINPADVFSLVTDQDDPIALIEERDPQDDDQDNNEESRSEFDAQERSARAKVEQRRSLKTQRVSFVLEDFNADELEDAVKRRLADLQETRRDKIAHQLRSPSFAALRNPFLLDQYIKQHSPTLRGSDNPPPLDVDSLLDNRVRAATGRVAGEMACDSTDLQGCFNFLVSQMWDSRSQGIDRDKLVQDINQRFGVDGSLFIRQLRLEALLTPDTPILLERTPVAERLFALELEKRVSRGSALITEIRPEEDSGVVAAYLRHLCRYNPPLDTTANVPSRVEESNPVVVAQQLLDSNPSWRRAVCNGLAQASQDDVQVVAFLATLLRPPYEQGAIDHHACRALGRLAARGGEALKWVANMYSSGSFEERLWGASALSEVLEFDPQLVGKIVARRLGHAAQIDVFAFNGDKRRRKWLRTALDPLKYPRHQEAAYIARKVSDSYAELVTHCEPRHFLGENGRHVLRRMFDQHFDWKFAEDLAELRGGQIAWDNEERKKALEDLSSEDYQTRLTASLAMRPASFTDLDAVADTLLERLRVETDGRILSRLLWASNGLSRPRYAARLLEALREGPTSQWNDRLVCGPALILLSRLAPRDAKAVIDALPRQLNHLSEVEALYLHESLVYAWWALADQAKQLPVSLREEPWRHLDVLARLPEEVISLSQEEYEVEKVIPTEEEDTYQSQLKPRDAWTFWAKGAALARLAILGRNRIHALESQMNEMGNSWPYYFSDLESLTRKHSLFLRDHPDFLSFQEALLVTVRVHINSHFMHLHTFDEEIDVFRRMGFQATRQCLTSLSTLFSYSKNIVNDVELVPRTHLGDWEQIYLIRSLLESGRRDADLVTLAQVICEELSHSQTTNGGAEREKTLAVLAEIRAETTETIAMAEYRERTKISFWGFSERGRGLARLTDYHPERLLEQFDESVQTQDDLLAIYQWPRETQDWRALLIAKVYVRMFDMRPIRRAEAMRLCQWVLTALQGLPDSELRQQWWQIYSAIHSISASNSCIGGTLKGKQTPIQNSHQQAARLINEAFKQQDLTSEWFDTYFEPSQNLILSPTFSIQDTEVSYSLTRNAQTLFCHPVVRLLGVALDKDRFDIDPVAHRMKERSELGLFQKEHGHFFHSHARLEMKQENKEKVLNAYEQLLNTRKIFNAPRDDEFEEQHVLICLLADRPDKAEELATLYLKEAESRTSVSTDTLNNLWYNLACAQARLDKEAEAHDSLVKAAEYRPLNREHLLEDTDLASLHDKEWFRIFVEHTTPQQTNQPIQYLLTQDKVNGSIQQNATFTITFECNYFAVQG